MAIDFRALQIQTNKIIASGSTGTGAKLLIYNIEAASISPPNQGLINPLAFNTASIGTDTFLYISGTLSTGSAHGLSVFGGSTKISGSLSVGSGLGANSHGTIIDGHQIYWLAEPSPSGAFIQILNNNIPSYPDSQDLTLKAGNTIASGAGGKIFIYGGNGGYQGFYGPTPDGGNITIKAGKGGDGFFAGRGGSVKIYAGDAGNASAFNAEGGSIIIAAGSGSTNLLGKGGSIYVYLGSPGNSGTNAGDLLVEGGYYPNIDELYGSGSIVSFGSEINKIKNFLINSSLTVPNDVLFYVSGTITASNTQYPSVAVFGGDLVASGSLMSTLTKTFVPIGSYVSSNATSSNPQVAGQALLNRSEVPARKIYLRTILCTTLATVTSSVRLWNITSGSYVEIGGTGITELHTTSTTPTVLNSINLVNAINFSTGSAIYEVQVYVATGSANVIHGSSMFVCSA